MDRIDKIFAGWDQWADRHSTVLGMLVVLGLAAIFAAAYYSSGSIHWALVVVSFTPLILMTGTVVLGLILSLRF